MRLPTRRLGLLVALTLCALFVALSLTRLVQAGSRRPRSTCRWSPPDSFPLPLKVLKAVGTSGPAVESWTSRWFLTGPMAGSARCCWAIRATSASTASRWVRPGWKDRSPCPGRVVGRQPSRSGTICGPRAGSSPAAHSCFDGLQVDINGSPVDAVGMVSGPASCAVPAVNSNWRLGEIPILPSFRGAPLRCALRSTSGLIAISTVGSLSMMSTWWCCPDGDWWVGQSSWPSVPNAASAHELMV